MIITLDIFSGMPNPSWNLSTREDDELFGRLAGKAMPAVSAAEPVLGYRGFIVNAASDAEAARAGLPSHFRLGGAALELTVPEGIAMPMLGEGEAHDTAHWLLSTARGKLDDRLSEQIHGMIKSLEHISNFHEREPIEEGGEEPRASRLPSTGGGCVIQNTAYNPTFWNTPSAQPRNNCYNYAMDCQSNTIAQPGKISGHPTNIMQCADVATAANYDGCTVNCVAPNKNVALVVWPGYDYHWYRLHTRASAYFAWVAA